MTSSRPTATREHLGWVLHESGPAGADHTVLLIPGGLGTAAFLDDVLAEPGLVDASIRFVATTVPGFGDTAPLDDLRMEHYAALGGQLARDLGCDVVVGHSLGANLALEMAAAGGFTGPIVLLAPSFSREDEFKGLATLDRIGRVPGIGRLAWAAMLRTLPHAMRHSLPAARRRVLVAEMQKADPRFCRAMVRRYFEYLDRHGSLVARLRDSGARA